MDEHKEQQVIDWTMGLLSPTEAEVLEREFEANPELKAFALEMKETVASISLVLPSIRRPHGLVQRVLRKEKKQALSMTWIPWAVAACFAVGMSLLWIDRIGLRHRIEQLEGSQQMAQLQIATLQSQIAAYKNSSVIVVWNAKTETGVAKLQNVPPAGPGKDYQLWVVDPSKTMPVNGGILPVKDYQEIKIPFKPDQPVNSVTKFIVSLEPAGGVSKSVGPAVFTSK